MMKIVENGIPGFFLEIATKAPSSKFHKEYSESPLWNLVPSRLRGKTCVFLIKNYVLSTGGCISH